MCVSITAASLCYGEIIPNSLCKILDSDHLDAANASILFDLGSGVGRLCIQSFFQYSNLQRVVGLELSPNRSKQGMDAVMRLYDTPPQQYKFNIDKQYEVIDNANTLSRVTLESVANLHSIHGSNELKEDESNSTRSLELRRGNLFIDAYDVVTADIVILQTAFYPNKHKDLIKLLNQLKVGCKLLSYENLSSIYSTAQQQIPFNPIAIDDTYTTSWCAAFHFHLYVKHI